MGVELVEGKPDDDGFTDGIEEGIEDGSRVEDMAVGLDVEITLHLSHLEQFTQPHLVSHDASLPAHQLLQSPGRSVGDEVAGSVGAGVAVGVEGDGVGAGGVGSLIPIFTAALAISPFNVMIPIIAQHLE